MIGTSLGPYKIIEQLGAGGMGEVYLGEDTRLGRVAQAKGLTMRTAGESYVAITVPFSRSRKASHAPGPDSCGRFPSCPAPPRSTSGPTLEPGSRPGSRPDRPIFNRHCVECHREGEIGPFPLTSYEEVEGWGETIREVISDGRMPPWFADPKYGNFANDSRLTEEERRRLFTWVDNGSPEGDPADLPERPKFVQGWRIGQPDAIFQMPETFAVPAEGHGWWKNRIFSKGQLLDDLKSCMIFLKNPRQLPRQQLLEAIHHCTWQPAWVIGQ